MSNFIKLLNANEEWLPLNGCYLNDESCRSGDDEACDNYDDYDPRPCTSNDDIIMT